MPFDSPEIRDLLASFFVMTIFTLLPFTGTSTTNGLFTITLAGFSKVAAATI